MRIFVGKRKVPPLDSKSDEMEEQLYFVFSIKEPIKWNQARNQFEADQSIWFKEKKYLEGIFLYKEENDLFSKLKENEMIEITNTPLAVITYVQKVERRAL